MKRIKKSYYVLIVIFFALNIIAAFHAYKLTHFTEQKTVKTKSPQDLYSLDKLSTLLLGVNNPKPKNYATPIFPFETATLQSNKQIECWYATTEKPIGTVLLFHGFGGSKSDLISKASIFLNNGYNCLLVDFMGSGNSEGIQTTIGFQEAKQVTTCVNFIKNKGEQNIYLHGTSMGAVAIMKAIKDDSLNPAAIIIECPFSSMENTVKARFKLMGVPSFPMAHLLLFWGSIENSFWAFDHNPLEYAKHIKCPTLLLYGETDPKVSLSETISIYNHLAGTKKLITYPNTGHENYLIKNSPKWENDILRFIHKTKKVASNK